MTSWRVRLRRLRLGVQALVATIVIVAAVVVGVMQLVVLPWLGSHPERIGAFLGERLHRPVRVDRVDARWERNGPLLNLAGVHIGVDQPDQPALLIAHAGLKINLFAFSRNARWDEFRLDGLDLNLLHGADGHWQLSGLAVGDSSDSSDQRALLDLGALVLNNLTLSINDAGSGRQFRFAADEMRLINTGEMHRLAARVRFLQTQSAPVDTVIEYDSELDSGTAYIGGKSLDLAAILRGFPVLGATIVRGTGRAQLWGHWHANAPTDARLEVALNDLLLEAQTPIELDDKRRLAPRVNFNEIAFGARWTRTQNGWSADLADLKLERQEIALAPAFAHIEKQEGAADDSAAGYIVQLQEIDVAAPATLAMLAEGVPSAWRRWLYIGNPEGVVRSASLRWSSASDFDIAANVAELGWRAVDKMPGARGVSGAVLADEQAMTIDLPAQNALSVYEPHVFRRPFEFSELTGRLAAYRTDTTWRVETDALAFEGEGFGGELSGAMEVPDAGGRPLIDAYAIVRHATVPAARLFWPINTMGPAAIAWLDRGLESGRVASGRAVIRGDLAEWPFRALGGRFEARADIDDLTLKYLPDWPEAEHVHASADFINTSLHVDADGGQVKGNRFNRASADIVDLGEAVVELDVNAQGAGRDLLGLLKVTPIGQRFGTQLLGVDVTGQGKVDFHLHVPVKQAEQLALTGTAVLSDAELADAKYALHLNHANGKVRFSQSGFSADDLAVTMHDQPATFGLAVGAFTGNPRHAVEATLNANLPAAKVLTYAPALSAYAEHIGGSANWSASFNADAAENGGQQLLVSSDLRGITSDLPAPLNKDAATTLPLQLAIGMPLAGGSIDLHLGNLVHMRGHMASPASPFAARVTFGGASEEAAPKSGFVISGKAAVLDLSGWMAFASSNSGDGGLLGSIDLQSDSMTAYGRDFGAAKFTLTRAADGVDLGLNGAQIDGTLHLPAASLHERGITAQFARLHWPEASDPESGAVTGENPAAIPPLHIHIADFRLGKEIFGEASVETYPIAGGSHFEQVSTHSPNIEMRAHGDWTGRSGSDRSTFSIELTAHNIGNMLDSFGYSGVIVGGAAVAHIEGNWAGAPSAFALAQLDGTLKVSMKDGRIPDADPGSARVLGLFNLAAIPRRLAFDFGDLFKSGFSFDSIEGLFTLKDGVAHTQNLEVHSPTADMLLKGSMGLKTKDWDQTVEVTPHVGGTLAIGGALIGGPVGAAAGVLLQGVFRNQINSVARAQYKVTGSWDNPKVTVLAKQTVKPKKPVPGESPPGKTPPADAAPKRGTG
jgi:uncharacterized protein (TIGR02099 family)